MSLKETISKSVSPRIKKKYDKSAAIYILQVFWDSLSCWQSKGVLKRGFLDICLTTSLAVFNFENTLGYDSSTYKWGGQAKNST